MIKKSVIIIAVITTIVTTSHLSWAYDGEVHYMINDAAVESSQLNSVLKDQLGIELGTEAEFKKGNITKPLWEWIADGGKTEDYGILGKYDKLTTRAYNHFHDPLKDWDKAGLDNIGTTELYLRIYGRTPVSSVLWGLKPGEQDFFLNFTGDWSWEKARGYYYHALTANTNSDKYESFANCFRALGQVMHLLQDASVPLHTRNDAHILPMTYETYTKENRKFLNYSPRRPDSVLLSDPQPQTAPTDYSHLPPVTGLFDRNQYNQGAPTPTAADNNTFGLAEYSNANFLTEDTMWDYQHPSLADTDYDRIDWLKPEPVDAEDGETDNRIYIEKDVGEQIEHLAAIKYWTYQLMMFYTPEIHHAFLLDEKCWKDYADKLIPRAVGYSAGLLDYFFRGRMEIKNPFVNIGSGLTITGIEFEVKNITPLVEAEQTIEPFESGSIDLAYQYIPLGQEEPVSHLMPDIYTITDASDSINTQYVPLTVTFPAEGIVPAGARDLSFALIFQGKLGTEEDAVAAQVHDFSGPGRIAFYFQPGGLGNESNIYSVLPDGSNLREITNASIPDSWYFSPAWSPDGTMLAFEKETCSDPDPDPYCDEEYYSRDIVVIDLASDESYPNNVLTTLEFFDPVNPPYPYLVTLPSFSPDGGHIVVLASDLALFNYALVVFEVSTGDWRYINDFDFWCRKDLSGSAPAWSPQGDKIAYYIHKKPDPVTDEMVFDRDIYLINPDGTGDIRLTDDDHLNTQPAWSPDGEWIVFVSDRDGGGSTDIWIMDKSGGNLQKICDCDPGCWSPTISPDRSRIAFEQDGDIHTVNLSGSGLTQITTSGYLTSSPAWSPFLLEPSEP